MTVRKVQGWYEKSMVRNVYGTNSLWYEKSGNPSTCLIYILPQWYKVHLERLLGFCLIMKKSAKNTGVKRWT